MEDTVETMDTMDTVEIFAEEDFSTMELVTAFIETYGWYLLVAAVAVIYAFSKYAAPSIIAYRKQKEEDEYSAKYHKDPDAIATRLAAQEAYARKLQEKYNRDADEYQKKMDEKEARKREEWLAKHGGPGGSGSKLGEASTSKTTKPDYNPLMGDTSRGYRATKKSPCGGGGCGK